MASIPPYPPVYDLLKIAVRSLDEETALATIAHGGALTNRSGALHGGIVSTLFDAAMSHAARGPIPDRVSLTVNMSINFLSPALGDLACEARVTRRGKSIAFVTAEAKNAEGKLIAEGHGSFMIRPIAAESKAG